VQLLAIAVYNRNGDVREVRFEPGRLNIVTGESGSGKSALLDIFEYCMGRDRVMMPIGPITATVVWYAALLQVGDSRAFVARPAPRENRATTQQAMLEFGADLEILPFDRLGINSDTNALRGQLGARIGIEENLHEPPPGALRRPLAAHLGHATLLCLQNQDEIAKRTLLFHRQGEQGMDQTLKDTIPYFLGAAPRDQALKRAQLRDAERQLTRVQSALLTAQDSARDVEAELQALLSEAHAAGLTDVATTATRDEAIAALTRVLDAPPPPPTARKEQDARRELEAQRRQLREDLRTAAEERGLLLEHSEAEQAYVRAVTGQVGRLTPLGLINDQGDDHLCPMCGSDLPEPDPTVQQLQGSLETLQQQLSGVETARPARREALAALDAHVDDLNERLRAADAAWRGIVEADTAAGDATQGERRQFTRGRISVALRTVQRTDGDALRRLQQQVSAAERLVQRLQAELDDDEERMQLDSRLLAVGDDMTRWTEELQLEHAGRRVRLDLNALTVVTETSQGAAPLWRIGSAANHVGAHLVAHLALHRYFTLQQRPVPHVLMLDQPTQAYYPSDAEKEAGVPTADADRAAVQRTFRLLYDVTAELAPNFQIIVCDHANLPDDWFQDSVVADWRHGETLIPEAWLSN
jgi:hypothetical protein